MNFLTACITFCYLQHKLCFSLICLLCFHLQTEISALHNSILISTAVTVCGLPGGTSLLDCLQGCFIGNATVETQCFQVWQ